jgi:hypothetical protein
MSGLVLRLDYARRRTLGENVTLKLLEKSEHGYKVTQTVTQGFNVGRVFSRVKGALVDVLMLDESAQVLFETLERAIAIDLVVDDEIRRYAFDSGKPAAIGLLKLYSCDLRANFGDKTAYAP